MCGFFAMWFFSGVVMMYIGYPSLTEAERLDTLPALKSADIKFPVTALTSQLPDNSTIEQLKLSTVLNRPAYLLKTVDQPWRGMFADTGEAFTGFSKEQAEKAARYALGHAENDSYKVNHLGQLEMDQWTVSSSLNAHRPLDLVELGGEDGLHFYISSLTGQVVRDTSRSERLWNWLGANLHWIYPLQLRKHSQLWSNVVVWLSMAGLISLLTGTVIGMLRLRIQKPYKGRRYTPYRGMMKYHHILGLSFLLFLSSYLFSGLMSMNPWKIFTERQGFSSQLHRFQHGDNPVQELDALTSVLALQQALLSHPQTKEVSWRWIGGVNHTTLLISPQQRISLPPGNRVALNNQIQKALPLLIPDSKVIHQQIIEEYDLYYYSHHGRSRPLPVLRVMFNDSESSWFHIDPANGEVLGKLTTKSRLQRWLFNGLHSFDFNFLLNNRPVWDIFVIALSSLGFIFSLLTLTIAWRRLWFKQKKRIVDIRLLKNSTTNCQKNN